jgi:hypothetical protein
LPACSLRRPPGPTATDPEQDRWWAETAPLNSGEASFGGSSDVAIDATGDPDAAGFVRSSRPRRRETREGESKEPPGPQVQMKEMAALSATEPEVLRPQAPWLYFPTLS